MKILVATEKPFAPVAVDGIKEVIAASGNELVLLEKGTKADLINAVADAAGLIVRSDIVDKEVLDAAKELGYKPNMDAVNLKTRHIKTVGVILCELATDIPSVIIRGITNVLYSNGIKVIIACSDDDPDREKENLLMMEKYGVDGIIISQCGFNENKGE